MFYYSYFYNIKLFLKIILFYYIFNQDWLFVQKVAIRVCGSGSCLVDPWVLGYIGWPEPNLFSKRVKNPQLKHDLFIKQVDLTW